MPDWPESEKQAMYQIIVQGQLDEDWSDWFGGLTITLERRDDGLPITRLTGLIIDQAALCGILNKICDLNLTLISVSPIKPNSGQEDL